MCQCQIGEFGQLPRKLDGHARVVASFRVRQHGQARRFEGWKGQDCRMRPAVARIGRSALFGERSRDVLHTYCTNSGVTSHFAQTLHTKQVCTAFAQDFLPTLAQRCRMPLDFIGKTM